MTGSCGHACPKRLHEFSDTPEIGKRCLCIDWPFCLGEGSARPVACLACKKGMIPDFAGAKIATYFSHNISNQVLNDLILR